MFGKYCESEVFYFPPGVWDLWKKKIWAISITFCNGTDRLLSSISLTVQVRGRNNDTLVNHSFHFMTHVVRTQIFSSNRSGKFIEGCLSIVKQVVQGQTGNEGREITV